MVPERQVKRTIFALERPTMIIQHPSGIRRRFLLAKSQFCPSSTQLTWLWLYVACLALLFTLANPAHSQSCATCKNETATVGFVANVCTHHDGYTVTLNGQTLYGFRSCAADIWVTTNKAYTQFAVDQTYVVTAGTDSCRATSAKRATASLRPYRIKSGRSGSGNFAVWPRTNQAHQSTSNLEVAM
jgi:hypothetical protein